MKIFSLNLFLLSHSPSPNIDNHSIVFGMDCFICICSHKTLLGGFMYFYFMFLIIINITYIHSFKNGTEESTLESQSCLP